MRVLVTGAGGYVGLHIVRELLRAGHAVTALLRARRRLGPLEEEPGLAVVEADLEQRPPEAAIEGHEVVVHAALVWGEPGTETRDVAVAARLFDAAGRAGVRRTIYLSSAAVHRPFAGEMTEDDRLATADVYGATKASGELYLRAACVEHGMSGVALRLGPVVGPPAFPGGSFRSDRRLAELVAAARAGDPIAVIEGEGRQLTDVASVARATRRLVTAEAAEPTYLCMDRELHPWERIAAEIVARAGSTSPVRVLPRREPGPVPRFRTSRIEALLGGPAPAWEALLAHVACLADLGPG